MDPQTLVVDGQPVRVTHPDKLLWPDIQATKADYIRYLLQVAPVLLPATRNRLLMMWCYPHGVGGQGHARKTRPTHAPAGMAALTTASGPRMVLNDTAALVWAANFGALELHVEPDLATRPGYPTYLAFDLDPSVPGPFAHVLDVALRVRDVLRALGLASVAKTSGATGLHIYVPIEARYTFAEARHLNKFVAEYLASLLPATITLERSVARRGSKLYFDYLQLWQGKTMAAAYSVRASRTATVSTPLTWAEVERGFDPQSFTMATLPTRIAAMGDLFAPLTTEHRQHQQSLNAILDFLRRHRSG